jgi:hypothetical protein
MICSSLDIGFDLRVEFARNGVFGRDYSKNVCALRVKRGRNLLEETFSARLFR